MCCTAVKCVRVLSPRHVTHEPALLSGVDIVQYRSSQIFINSGDLPLFGVEDIYDAKSSADIVLNMHTEGDNEKSALEVGGAGQGRVG